MKNRSPIDLVHRGRMLQDGLLPRHLDDALRTEFQLCNAKKQRNLEIDFSRVDTETLYVARRRARASSRRFNSAPLLSINR